jgi:hypothetical protein
VVTPQDEDFPFCSDRCRASGGYRISSPILDPEVLEGLSGNQQPHGEHDEED